MMPSVEFLKEQANRLIAYMGDNHRFRLKPASAYEAVASQWGEHDWNTLYARSMRGDAGDASHTGAAPTGSPADYPLDWGQYGEQLHVPRNDWQRHVLTQGADADARRDWLQRHLAGQLERGCGGVFVNAFGGQLPVEAREMLEHAGVRVLDLASGQGTSCNLLGGLEPEQTADILVHGLRRFPDAHSFRDDYWRARMRAALTTLTMVLRACGAHITLSRICTELRLLAEDRGERLLAACPGGPERATMQALHDSLGADSPEVGSVRSIFTEVANDMDVWLTHPSLRMLFADEVNAPGLLDWMCGEQCLVIEMAEQESLRMVELQGGLLLGVAAAAVSHALTLPRKQRGAHPRLLALAEAHEYLVPGAARIAEQGRSAGWTLLVTIPDENSLLRLRHTGRDILRTVWNRMYLGGLPESGLNEVMARLTQAESVVVSPGRIQHSEPLWVENEAAE